MRNPFWYRADDYYQVYAWDVVDIFFATTVASLPALNGLLDTSIIRLKSLGASSAWIFSRIRLYGSSSQNPHGDNTRLSDRLDGKSFGYSAGDKQTSSSDQFEEPVLHERVNIELHRPVSGSHIQGKSP